MLKKYASNLLSIIIILIVVLGAFKVLICGEYTAKWDMMNQFLPCRYFISECVHHHIFPLWCPYINFGYPFYADPQSGLFYPVTWVIALTTGYSVYTIGAEYVLHVFIAGVAFYSLLRGFKMDNYTATVFGIVYCLSGVFIGNAQHLTWIITLAWAPLVMLSFSSMFIRPGLKTTLSLGLFLCLGITGGYPGFYIILFYFFIFYAVINIISRVRTEGIAVIRPVVLFLGLAVVVFTALALPYLYSFTHSLAYIARGKPVTLAQANNIALTPRAAISFLFPFATTCSSYRLNTDISMANIYCGFLLFPLMAIAVVKGRITFFHKAIFAFAVIALMAAMGDFFKVRTWLYYYVPGLNMLRHAAIFRVFTLFGFIFIAATGFDHIVKAIRTNAANLFVKSVLIMWLIVLVAALGVVVFKNGYTIHGLPFFNVGKVSGFNAQQNVYSHIMVQGLLQICLLLILSGAFFLQRIGNTVRIILVCAVVIADIYISAQLNIPATVVSDVSPAVLQAKLNKLSSGFPVPPLSPMGSFTHYSDGSTLPIWYNLSFFKKIPAKDGFNSFYLQSVDDLNNSPLLDSFMQKPVVFLQNANNKIQLIKFDPGNIEVKCSLITADTICLQQNFYKGWTTLVDNQGKIPAHRLCSMSTAVPSGNHIVSFVYRQDKVKYMLLLSFVTLLLIAGFLVVSGEEKIG